MPRNQTADCTVLTIPQAQRSLCRATNKGRCGAAGYDCIPAFAPHGILCIKAATRAVRERAVAHQNEATTVTIARLW